MKDKYKTLIISCWVVLLCCFVVKLLGGNFFEIVCKNENFVRLCKFVDGNILKYILSFILYYIGTYIYFKAVLAKITKRQGAILKIILSAWWIIKLLLYKFDLLIFILDIIFMIVTPVIINPNKQYIWADSIVGFGLNFIFQSVSVVTKSLSFSFVDDKFIIGTIFSIDYYIMVILYYLYRTKECNENGINGSFIFRKRR